MEGWSRSSCSVLAFLGDVGGRERWMTGMVSVTGLRIWDGFPGGGGGRRLEESLRRRRRNGVEDGEVGCRVLPGFTRRL